jgi:hypothetical protein
MHLPARRSKSWRYRPRQSWSGHRCRVAQTVCASRGTCRRSTITLARFPSNFSPRPFSPRPSVPRRSPAASTATPPSHRAPTRSTGLRSSTLRKPLRIPPPSESTNPSKARNFFQLFNEPGTHTISLDIKDGDRVFMRPHDRSKCASTMDQPGIGVFPSVE